MEKSIEIYIRESSGRNLLNIYVPVEFRELFIRGVSDGSVEEIGVPINFEMSMSAANRPPNDDSGHVSLDIKSINFLYVE